MREIKFRAWTGKEMVVSSSYESGGGGDISLEGFWAHCETHNHPVMQYTGLKDKNGRDIYEGDVVEREDKGLFTVRWEQKCSAFLHDGGDDAWMWQKEDYSPIYTVVGNIYENPELLK